MTATATTVVAVISKPATVLRTSLRTQIHHPVNKSCTHVIFATANSAVATIWSAIIWVSFRLFCSIFSFWVVSHIDVNRTTYGFCHHLYSSVHTGEKPFSCEICQRRFREQSDLRKHKKVHANNNGTTVKCLVCKRNPTMSRHSSKCSSCNAVSVTTATAARAAAAAAAAAAAMTVKRHSNSMDEIVPRFDANNKKSFACKYCDRTFGSSSNLKRHIMIHTGWLLLLLLLIKLS